MLSASLRPVLVRALLLIVSTGICLLGLELVLRAQPSLLGDVFANGVLSKYHTRPGGIYYLDPKLRIHFMIPNLKTQMYYNGYVWTHETDAYGFRNKRTAIPADIMLLGDSFIYGHGVDFEFTVGSFLEQLTGLSVVNLGRQGDSSFQEAYLLTEYIGVFRPRIVFYMFSFNDISDLTVFLTRAEMQAFIDQPVESIRYPPRTDVTQARSPSLIRRLAGASYVVKAYRWLKWRLGVGPALAAPAEDENSLEWRYTKKAIAYMQYVAAKHGAQLVIAPISPFPFSRRDHEILGTTAKAYGLPLVDTSSLTIADASLWLPRDGHFSPAGARRMAELLADYARQRKERPPMKGRARSPRAVGPASARKQAATGEILRDHLRRGRLAEASNDGLHADEVEAADPEPAQVGLPRMELGHEAAIGAMKLEIAGSSWEAKVQSLRIRSIQP